MDFKVVRFKRLFLISGVYMVRGIIRQSNRAVDLIENDHVLWFSLLRRMLNRSVMTYERNG